jgi:hypothetical protein
MDCHDKMKISDIFVMFTKLFLPHLVPKSITIKKNSIYSIVTEEVLCADTRNVDAVTWLSS